MPPDPTVTMADVDADLDDEQYDSAEDEDFTLDAAADADEDDAELSSSDEEAGAEPAAKRRKTAKGAEKNAVEGAELDSGDEAMIRKAKERKKKRKRGGKVGGSDDKGDVDMDVDFDDDDDDEEEGGTGGFVRTRAMKMRVQEERKPLAKIDGATIDVDEVWARMNAPDSDLGSSLSQVTKKDEATTSTRAAKNDKDAEPRDQDSARPEPAQEKRAKTQYPDEMVKIKRTYKFAGEMITEEKLVPKDSAEAKLYLSGNQDGQVVAATKEDIASATGETVKLRRPLRKVSRFDPNPTGLIKKSWEKQPVSETAGKDGTARGPKINTVEKSRLDWAAYVDRAGIKDELRVHSKAKEGFLGRMDFLDRVDAKREEERRNARLKGM
ncbi:bucentaur or craniofacial development-domain-containing protein [Aspergillus egyptiacus]|nr:bucentaur or craniofacial development-domain-containing protein [Aspergillus egyptiacus]